MQHEASERLQQLASELQLESRRRAEAEARAQGPLRASTVASALAQVTAPIFRPNSEKATRLMPLDLTMSSCTTTCPAGCSSLMLYHACCKWRPWQLGAESQSKDSAEALWVDDMRRPTGDHWFCQAYTRAWRNVLVPESVTSQPYLCAEDKWPLVAPRHLRQANPAGQS